MLRVLPYLVEIALLVFCLVDCISSPPHLIRNLEKGWWIVLIVLLPLIGGIAWLVAGRPVRTSAGGQWRIGSGFPADERPRTAYKRNEDDPAFLAEMARIDREHAESLKKWEAKLAAQEAEQRRRQQDGSA